MRLLAVILLSIVAAIVVGIALVLPNTGLMGEGGDKPSRTAIASGVNPKIAVASLESLEALTENSDDDQVREAAGNCARDIENAIQLTNASQDGAIAGEDSEDETAAEPSSPVTTNNGFQTANCQAQAFLAQRALVTALSNRLESNLSGALAQTGRFDVAEPTSVFAAFSRLALKSSQQVTVPQDRSDEKKSKASVADLVQLELQKMFSQNANMNSALTADFKSIASELEVDYFLFVDLIKPDFYLDAHQRAYENKSRLIYRTNPIFAYRLYDVSAGRIVLSSQARVENGLALDVEKSVIGRLMKAGVSSKTSYDVGIPSMQSDLIFERIDSVTSRITSRVLDEIAPAQIAAMNDVAGERQFIITRGSNNGVAIGDEFEVRQIRRDAENNPIRITDPQSGAVLESPTDVIGSVRVVDVSPSSNVATAVRMDLGDKPFGIGDFIIATSGALADDSLTGASVSGKTVPPASNRRTLGVDKSPDDVALIAVTEFEVRGADTYQTRSLMVDLLNRALTRRLSGDKRYRLVSRQDLAQIQQEYDLGLEVAGHVPTGERAKVNTAGYLVTGVIDIGQEETRHAISLRGQSQSQGSTYKMTVSGELTILGANSEVITAKRVNVTKPFPRAGLGQDGAAGALADAFAEEAAMLLRQELYPLKIVNVSADKATFVINGGEDVGLKIGTLLTAYSLGEEIRDLDTGIVLAPGARTRLGTIEIVDVYGQASSAREKSLNGKSLSLGDVVEIAAAPVVSPANAGKAKPSKPAEPEPVVPF